VFVGRPPEQLKSLEEIVKKAVGYDDARGDQITLSNVPFTADLGLMEEVSPKNRWLEMLKSHQKLLMNSILLILLFFLVIRPIIKKFQQMPLQKPALAPPQSHPALPGAAAGAPGSLLGAPEGQPEGFPSMRDRIEGFVERDPDKAREIILTWLREGT